MKILSKLLISTLFGTSLITNAQLSFITNGQTITSSSSWDIRLVDIDGDQDLDAYFENKIWLNDSMGNFTKTGSSFGVRDAFFADFNNDNFTDVVCNDSIYLNNGNYQYIFSGIIPSPMEMIYAQPLDIEGDGDMDLIIGDQYSDSLFINDGAGNFVSSERGFGGWGQCRYSVADLNNDNNPDVIVSIPHTPPPTMSPAANKIWFRDDEGQYSLFDLNLSPGVQTRNIETADFDKDGDHDLLVVGGELLSGNPYSSILLNDGNGIFTLKQTLNNGYQASFSALADFDNDGDTDVFFSNGTPTQNGSPNAIWLNDGQGNFIDSELRLGNSNSIRVAVGDFNNDTKTDIIVVNVKFDVSYNTVQSPVEIWINNSLFYDYFGQTSPGNTAIIFAPDLISLPDRLEGSIAFTPDGNECYFGVYEYINDSFLNKIFYTKYEGNSWTQQEEAAFSIGQNFSLSSLSSDGNRLFLEKDDDLWKVERSAEGWGEPQLLSAPVNSSSTEFSYSESDDGTIYISSNRPGGYGQYFDIWRIRSSSVQAENLGPIINSAITQGYPYIAPDGSYLIFSQVISENPDLVISFNKGNDEWTVPVDMNISGAGINVLNQVSPIITPDGEYLFFNRHTGFPITNNADIYWVSTNILDTLKQIAIPTTSDLIETDNLISVFPNPTPGRFTIYFNSTLVQKVWIEIFNLHGTQVLERTIQSANSKTIDLTGYPAGIYLIKVDTGRESINKKIIKN